MIEPIIFGRGEIGVHCGMSFGTSFGIASIFLSEFSKPHPIGVLTKAKGKPLVEIQFENLEGLNTLLDRILHCKANLELQENIPLELRFGA